MQGPWLMAHGSRLTARGSCVPSPDQMGMCNPPDTCTCYSSMCAVKPRRQLPMWWPLDVDTSNMPDEHATMELAGNGNGDEMAEMDMDMDMDMSRPRNKGKRGSR
ncbi:hypothetical protein E4U43_001728 [Claviceps pusilla]|uniref:Uncharacterized protein n=1 Tax=Claviceps pusilla TaxID=123648 RepID=A0A9P7N8H8_9HYPO|nr:hypothetical protein E4U43_001728 [Claviceps pusilla]